jgi:aldose 1-epimerase
VLDFRQPRAITDDMHFDDLLTGRDGNSPIRLIYKDWQQALEIHADALYEHVILFSAEDGTIAVEPQTNANDAFNLHENRMSNAGVFSLQAAESINAAIRLELSAYRV